MRRLRDPGVNPRGNPGGNFYSKLKSMFYNACLMAVNERKMVKDWSKFMIKKARGTRNVVMQVVPRMWSLKRFFKNTLYTSPQSFRIVLGS